MYQLAQVVLVVSFTVYIMILTLFILSFDVINRYQVNKGKIASFFPLHDTHRLKVLHDEWLDRKVLPWKQPLFKVKEYFGEKIGLYFQVL